MEKENYELADAKKGHMLTGTRHATIQAAKRVYSASQRKLYSVRVFALPGGGYDSFPAGHPVPAGSQEAE